MSPETLQQRYYLPYAAAFIRGTLGDPAGTLSDEELVALAAERGLRIHRFKRSGVLPRVQRVLGFLRGVLPQTMVDIGTGRGVFLWPLLEALPDVTVHCLDLLPHRVEMLQTVSRGGISRLHAELMDARQISLADGSADVVTALEVLEHLDDPGAAARHLVRVCRQFVVASVPSKPDDNPEHIQLFSGERLRALFLEAGAARVDLDYVLGHIIAIVHR